MPDIVQDLDSSGSISFREFLPLGSYLEKLPASPGLGFGVWGLGLGFGGFRKLGGGYLDRGPYFQGLQLLGDQNFRKPQTRRLFRV